MRAHIPVTNRNVKTGNISLPPDVVKGYWSGLVTGLEIYTTDQLFLESVSGDKLEELMTNITPRIGENGDRYYLAKRFMV